MMKNYTRIRLFFIFFVIISFLSEKSLFSQYLPVITNEQGDTISYTWPIPDSLLCVKDEVIIKFRTTALYLNKLCFEFTPGPPIISDPAEDWYYEQKSQMMSQQFPIDTLVADSTLRETIKSFGGIYLTRITAASPCLDTISITRYGDTIKCEDYLWLLLKLDNDTSTINACILLTMLFQNLLEGVEPNYCTKLYGEPPTPEDPHYHGEQRSLWPDWTNVEPAWFYQTGSLQIRVGIIDNGIWWHHCDLGVDKGFDKKVGGGWNFVENSKLFDNAYGSHGTAVAGIIGAITNGPDPGCGVFDVNCSPFVSSGIAGIAGGWWPDNLGCQLYGYLIDNSLQFGNPPAVISNAIGAIRQAATGRGLPVEQVYRGSGYGDGVHIINCSWGLEVYNETLRSAFNYAFENGVSIVAARGIIGSDYIDYPSCFDVSWITSVGGVGYGTEPLHKRHKQSTYGQGLDILAPSSTSLVYSTTVVKCIDDELLASWDNLEYTSFAAPHVAGAIALLRSEFLQQTNHTIPEGIAPEPEDYENMLKAAATDLNYGLDPELLTYTPPKYSYTLPGYDTTTG